MKVEVFASGSSGNCCALTSDDETILLDCGISAKATLERLYYLLPDAILVTHEHGDHAQAAKDFLNRGVEIFMTAGTAEALKLSRHNLHVVQVGEMVKVGRFKVEVLPSYHDAAEPANFVVEDSEDRLLYVTDTGKIPEVTGTFTKILIEANHDSTQLLYAPIDQGQKFRILRNHLNVEAAADFLENYPGAKVWLIHVSSRHGEKDKFAQIVERTADVEIMKY